MKKRRVIIIVAVAAAVLLALAAWQRENLAALLLFNKPEAELNARMEQNDKAVADAISRLPGVHVNELTPEEREALRAGKLTEAEAIERITGSPAGAAVAQTGTDKKAAEARIAQLVARVYVMRDTYVSLLEGLKNSAIAEYKALPADKRTADAKKQIAFKYIGKASAMEAQCDGEITSILDEMTTLVSSIDGNTTVVADVKAAYAEEKALKKAYYLRQYTN